MPNRASATEVKGIITTSMDDPRVDNFITTANAVVNQHLTGENLSDDLLALIERWLAAHFLAIDEARVTQEDADGVSRRYEGTVGTGLNATRFGQQVILLDPTGKLLALETSKLDFIGRAASGRMVENG